jgi:hypothetical protein
MENNTRPPIGSLACPYYDCQDYGKKDAGNLKLRKVYGCDRFRYLSLHRKDRSCSREFSERKNTPLWNSPWRAKGGRVQGHLGG